jgi:branched-chain amino acid transport system substrate-binding protein
MRKWYRLVIFAIGVTALAAALGACGTTGSSGNLVCNGKISIASELPTTGTDGTEGLPAQNAVELAVNQNKDLGGGYTLSLIKYNDVSTTLGKHDPSLGATNVTNMVANPCIFGFVGPFNSNVGITEIPISEDAGLAMISPANTNPGLTLQQYAQANGIDFGTLHPAGKPESYFRIPGNDVAQGTLDADLAIGAAPDGLGAKSAYVVDDQETYGVGIANYFTSEFQNKGGTILGRDGIPANGAAQIPGLAQKIAAKHPDVVYYGGVTSGGGGTLKAQLVAAGYTGPMVGGDGIADDGGFLTQAGATNANNTYGSVGAPDSSTFTSGAAAQFVSDYKAAYSGDLGAYSANSYDSAKILIQVLKALISGGKTITRAAVLDGVQNVDYNGVTGHITFDKNGDNSAGGIFALYVVKDGQWAFLRQVNATGS